MMKHCKNERGIALVLALSLLVMIATFAAFLTSKTRAALIQANNFKNSSKACCLAKAGLHRALYELKFHAQSGHAACAGTGINAYDAKNEAWYFNYGSDINVDLINATNPSFAGLYSTNPRFTEEVSARNAIKLRIIDTASLINLNTPDTVGLSALLLNLRNGTLTAGEVTTIIASRPSTGYKRVSDIKRFINETKYTAIAPYLTTHAFVDAKLIKTMPGQNRFASISNNPADGEMRAPINVNTADYEVLRALFRGLDAAISNTEADELSRRIRDRTATNPFSSWNEFDTFINSIQNVVFSNPSSDSAIVKRAVNPNRPKDAARTTDLCFASEGYFEIRSLGTVTNPFGTAVASRELKIVSKIYDVFRLSTRDDLIGRPSGLQSTITDDDGDGAPNILDTSYNNPTDLQSYVGNYLKPGFRNTTWYDSTPIEPNDDLGYVYRNNYTVIPGSIKLGFWDNFDESPEESNLIWLTNRLTDPAIDHMVDVGTTPFWNSATSTAPALDVNDNELWHDFDDNPMDDVFIYNGIPIPSPFAQTEGNDDDFVAFRLGSFYSRWDPASTIINTYRRWGYDMYLRVFNSDGPRTVASHIGIAPGISGTDFPGRDYRDVGYITWRYDESRDPFRRCCLAALSTIGNFYGYETDYAPYDMDGNGEVLNFLQAIRNVIALYPPAAFLPPPTEPQIIDASHEPFAFANDPQPPLFEHLLAPNYTNRLNSIYLVRSNPWNIPWYWEGSQRISAFSVASQTTPLRDKTYRIITKGDNALLQATYAGRSNYSYVTMLNESSFLPHQNGSISLYGKASHPAWDDLRIIGTVGEYTTAAFSPGVINASNNNILWGTFAWTETINYNATSGPRLTVALLCAAGNPPAENASYPSTVFFSPNEGGNGGPIRNAQGAIRAPNNYMRVYLNMGVTDVSPNNARAPDIPVFEDATITYLPETLTYYVQES
ncbi:MAG: hypothetical protein JW938_06600 [Candidatus Omnitrophica bacterium]|nr:hypothetical protein [Candidatus Omnitrophota bacterium]